MTEETTAVVVQERPLPEPAKPLSTEQKTLIRDSWFKGATEGEFNLAIAVCNRLRLDPFAKQVYFIKIWDGDLRREVLTAVTSIDGFRVVAERTGLYRGQTRQEWCGPDGVWKEVWLADTPPAAARCGVYRDGFPEPVFAVARYKSFVKTKKNGEPNKTWTNMPDLMLHKCAEALALRKAFPNDLSGAYTDDEMGQAMVTGNEPKQLTDGTHGFGFKGKRETINQATGEVVSKPPSQTLTEFLRRIGKAESQEELADCKPNGELEPQEREEAKRAWLAKKAWLEKQRDDDFLAEVQEELAPPPQD